MALKSYYKKIIYTDKNYTKVFFTPIKQKIYSRKIQRKDNFRITMYKYTLRSL
jgi:hypothetical protein